MIFVNVLYTVRCRFKNCIFFQSDKAPFNKTKIQTLQIITFKYEDYSKDKKNLKIIVDYIFCLNRQKGSKAKHLILRNSL